MALRTRIPVYARRAALMAALGALLAPATAGAATAHASKKAKKYPVITSVRPMETNIGKTLTIRGRNFKAGRNKNTVVFKRDGGRAVFVKAEIGTRKLLKVKLPAKLEAALREVNGSPSMTRFRLRVLSDRLSKSFTSAGRSPRIGPELPPAPPKIEDQSVTNPDGDCDGDGVKNGIDGDDDNDLLPDEDETKKLHLDPCKSDTDGDGVEDGYEIRSAQDWNDDEYQAPNGFLPYPTKRPYPNALDNDANVDHDGDSLTLKEEYDLWKFTITQGAPRDLGRLSYSAGEQYSVYYRDASGRRHPNLDAVGYDKQDDFLEWAGRSGYRNVELADVGVNWFDDARVPRDIRDMNRNGTVETDPNGAAWAAEETYYDIGDDGKLSDDERDEDADGLSNFDETRGCTGSQDYWTKLYEKETKYYLAYSGTRLDDPDTDGDLVRDGADDIDHDDLPNMMECSRTMVTTLDLDPRPAIGDPPADRTTDVNIRRGFVNPFNPCLPSKKSRSCPPYVSLDGGWAPFVAQDKYFYVWN